MPTCSPDLFAPTVYRSSDHDPVLLGLSLVRSIDGTPGRDTLVGTGGEDRITGGMMIATSILLGRALAPVDGLIG